MQYCCRGKAISIKYCECVFVALGMQRVMRMRLIVTFGLPGCVIFFPHYLTNVRIKKKKTLLNIKKMCVFSFVQLLSADSYSKTN